MGFLKNVWGGVKDAVSSAVKGNVKGALNGAVNAVTGSSSGGGGGANPSPTPYEAARATVINKYSGERLKYYKAQGMSTLRAIGKAGIDAIKYADSPAGKAVIAQIEAQLKAGENAGGTVVGNILKGLLNSAVTGVGAGLEKGLGTATEAGIKTAAGGLIKSAPAGSLKDQLGGYLADIGNSALMQWLKKNWFWIALIVVPFGFFFLSGVKLFATGGKKRRAAYARKSGTGFGFRRKKG